MYCFKICTALKSIEHNDVPIVLEHVNKKKQKEETSTLNKGMSTHPTIKRERDLVIQTT